MDDFTNLEAIDKRIEVIRQDIFKIIESTNLTINSKKETLEFNSQLIKALLDQKTELGWTDIRGKNLAILELDRLKEGLITGTEQKLNELVNKQTVERKRLESIIPTNDKRLRPIIKIAQLFETRDKVPNYLLAHCITSSVLVRSQRQKLGKKYYESDKTKYDKKIKNCFRTLNKYFINTSKK